MNHDINLGGTSLAAFLDWIGLPQVSRKRVIEIDRKLADAIASGDPDANGCADLILEATDLMANLDPPGFDWKGWAETMIREKSMASKSKPSDGAESD